MNAARLGWGCPGVLPVSPQVAHISVNISLPPFIRVRACFLTCQHATSEFRAEFRTWSKEKRHIDIKVPIALFFKFQLSASPTLSENA